MTYDGEHQLPMIQSLIEKELSEPYSVFTYRYFVNNWPKLCFLVSPCLFDVLCEPCDGMVDRRCLGKPALGPLFASWPRPNATRSGVEVIWPSGFSNMSLTFVLAGYIAMLAVEKEHRKRKIGGLTRYSFRRSSLRSAGTALVRRVITAMTDQKADVVSRPLACACIDTVCSQPLCLTRSFLRPKSRTRPRSVCMNIWTLSGVLPLSFTAAVMCSFRIVGACTETNGCTSTI